MGVQVEGIDLLMFRLRRGGAKAQKGLSQAMLQEAMDIRDLARQMAPVDEGDLERAIKVRQPPGTRQRDALGRFVSASFIIEVDGDEPAGTNREGKVTTVGDYAYVMHEHLAPFGTYNLGKRSRAKQAANPGVMVGGKYLERAVAEIEQGLVNRLIEAVSDEIDDLD